MAGMRTSVSDLDPDQPMWADEVDSEVFGDSDDAAAVPSVAPVLEEPEEQDEPGDQDTATSDKSGNAVSGTEEVRSAEELERQKKWRLPEALEQRQPVRPDGAKQRLEYEHTPYCTLHLLFVIICCACCKMQCLLYIFESNVCVQP